MTSEADKLTEQIARETLSSICMGTIDPLDTTDPPTLQDTITVVTDIYRWCTSSTPESQDQQQDNSTTTCAPEQPQEINGQPESNTVTSTVETHHP